MAKLDSIECRVTITKRWFFWPAAIAIVALGKVGIVRDERKAASWLADHATRIDVR